MDNHFDNVPEQNHSPQYTDPNGPAAQDYSVGQQNYSYWDPNMNQQYGQGNYSQNNYNQNYGQNYGQNNYNQNYGPVMDTSPLSLGQWVLTILASMIPCAGIILYFVWAFSKNGNVNRRNYCRASLIITGVVMLIYVIFFIIFGAAMAGSSTYY